MPPKMFKIKKAGGVKEEDVDELLVSDYQQERIEKQAAKAEEQGKEDARRAIAEQSSAATAGSVKPDEPGDKTKRAGAPKPYSAAPTLGSRAAALASTPMSYGVAEALPVNTMDIVLSAPPTDVNHYPPMVLNPNAVEQYAAKEVSAIATPSGQPVKNGTAFLEEGRREMLGSYAANKEFFDTHGQGLFAPKRQENDNAYGADADIDDDAFMLMQLPKPVTELASSCSIDQMAPGRVGKLTVYKSGRATMTIGGVVVDVALEPQRVAGAAGTEGGAGEGISQFAVAVDGSDLARRGCYQLCWIPRKVVCTPHLENEE